MSSTFAAFSTFAILLVVCSLLRSSQADYDCSAKDDGWYYDPEFCHIYWRCIHGTSEEFECASGTAWDHHENRCNWLDSVDCTRAEKTTEKVPTEDEEEEGEQELTDGHGEHHQHDEEDEAPPAPVVKQKKKSKKKNRKLNSNKRMLDEDNKDDSDDHPTSRKKSDTEAVLSDPSLPSALPSTQSKENGAGIECQPTGIYALPDPIECSAYYQCEKGVQTRLHCPERQLFDADKRTCHDFERVNCGSRAVNLADKNQCINKRDGIHPDTERDCHYYYQCVAQNKMREAKCAGDQKFSSYTGRCGPANNAPVPCGTFVPGSTGTAVFGYSVLVIAAMLMALLAHP